VSLAASLKQRLFRWKSDGSGTFRLNQRRIFILPTRAGMVYAITLVAMFTGAINYNLALGHALVFLLTGLGLIGMLHTFRNLLWADHHARPERTGFYRRNGALPTHPWQRSPISSPGA
jgi:hypothetical protein